MRGWIMPAPLANLRIAMRSPAAILMSHPAVFGRVSVVMIARAAPSAWEGPWEAASVRIPGSIFERSSDRPITPVESTRTWSARHPRPAAVSSAMRRASLRPRSPMQALAHPELAITARIDPGDRSSSSWS